uniref:Uncharacterized protein n=1 Tax=Vitis vinifera TaxID=29760 RepID=A5BRL0_VITVI|nr:hypothetical protein VITISV_002772 [Vitis vinifera]
MKRIWATGYSSFALVKSFCSSVKSKSSSIEELAEQILIALPSFHLVSPFLLSDAVSGKNPHRPSLAVAAEPNMEQRDDQQNHQRREHDSPAACKRHRRKTNIKFEQSLSVETVEKFRGEIVVFSGQWPPPLFLCVCVSQKRLFWARANDRESMGLICYLIQRGLHGLLYGKIAFLSEFEPWEQCFVTFALVPQWAKIKRGAKINKK